MSGGASLAVRRRLGAVALAVLLALGLAAAARGGSAEPGVGAGAEPGELTPHASIAGGEPWDGALYYGVKLAPEGEDHFTWDPAVRRKPNRPWRRWAADGTLAIVLRVLAQFRAAHPGAPRIGIGDLSRPRGGKFGRRFGGLGHASHQNGLDADVYYPRADRREWRPSKPARIDDVLAQDLVRRFVRAGAQYVFVGPRTGLRGPKGIVQALVHHDDHMHVRFPPGLGAPGSG
jgi:murein endopeptidase